MDEESKNKTCFPAFNLLSEPLTDVLLAREGQRERESTNLCRFAGLLGIIIIANDDSLT